MILDYLLPNRVYSRLVENQIELKNHKKFRSIVLGLQESGKLEAMGLSLDRNANLYLGINLNPELLMYSDTSQTSVELKMITEKMNKYNDFFTKEGILDHIKVEYDRVKTDDYYGYVFKISYSFKKYRLYDMIYDLAYFFIVGTISAVGAWHFASALL